MAKHPLPAPLGAISQPLRLARCSPFTRVVAYADSHTNSAYVAGSISSATVDHQRWNTATICRLRPHAAALHLHLGTDILRLRIRYKPSSLKLRRCNLVGIYEYDNRRIDNHPYNRHRQVSCRAATYVRNVDAATLHGLYLEYLPTRAKREGLNPKLSPSIYIVITKSTTSSAWRSTHASRYRPLRSSSCSNP